ncbi:hypothetical protein [Massilicoli timonensis]|uniref:hypothetical protein n=1 Tax=Massilicoli timonensis TaxID=2015901 RepID=UPI003AAE7B41
MKFDLGEVVMTRGISNLMETDFALWIHDCLQRHGNGDWGDLCEEDKQINEMALKEGDRILSAYKHDQVKIYIITEYDRSITTILLAEEY